MLGDIPESHHLRAATSWQQLGKFKKAISHYVRYLELSEDAEVQAALGYCYGASGNWPKALEVYRSISNPMADPLIALGLAEAEINAGSLSEARRIVAIVSANHDGISAHIGSLIDFMNARLDESENA